MSQKNRGRVGHFVFSIAPKNTNMAADDEILIPVKFRKVQVSVFRGGVEKVSANQRPGGGGGILFFRSA